MEWYAPVALCGEICTTYISGTACLAYLRVQHSFEESLLSQGHIAFPQFCDTPSHTPLKVAWRPCDVMFTMHLQQAILSHDNRLSFLQQEVLYAWNVFVLLAKNPPLLHNMLRYTWTELLIVEEARGELPFTLLHTICCV